MSGDLRNYNHRGIIPRALNQIFREVDLRVDRLYNVQVGVERRRGGIRAGGRPGKFACRFSCSKCQVAASVGHVVCATWMQELHGRCLFTLSSQESWAVSPCLS
jgi:hypothetical protein